MSESWLASGLSPMATKLRGSSILVIAAQVRAMVAAGRDICNLTIGDFKPAEYPIPARLRDACVGAINEGYTNYPPPNGITELRQAVVDLYQQRMGITVDPAVVTIASGARPLLYACYRALIAPGDTVVYAVPSWNNDHYSKMLGGRAVEVQVGPEDHFFPRPDQIRPHLGKARLVALNTFSPAVRIRETIPCASCRMIVVSTKAMTLKDTTAQTWPRTKTNSTTAVTAATTIWTQRLRSKRAAVVPLQSIRGHTPMSRVSSSPNGPMNRL